MLDMGPRAVGRTFKSPAMMMNTKKRTVGSLEKHADVCFMSTFRKSYIYIAAENPYCMTPILDEYMDETYLLKRKND